MLRGRIALQIQVPLRLLCNIWHDTVHETLMSPPVYIANKGLTEMLNPLEATYKKPGGGLIPDPATAQSPFIFSPYLVTATCLCSSRCGMASRTSRPSSRPRNKLATSLARTSQVQFR